MKIIWEFQSEIDEIREVLWLNFDDVCMYIMCLIIFEEKTEIQDQYLLSLNPVQKANDPESGS